jgi:hypothetical protein
MRTLPLLLWLVSSLWAGIASADLKLEGATDSLELVTSAAGSIDYTVSWSNVTATALTTPGTSKGNISTATTTTLVAAPSASNWRYIRTATIYNASTTAANAVTLQIDVSATNRLVGKFSLAPGEYAVLDESGKLNLYTASGVARVQPLVDSGYNGTTYSWQKAATAKDAAGYWYSYMKDAGFPGAAVPGAPGVNGWDTDCSAATNAADPAGAAQVGAHRLPNPASGNYYLTNVAIAGSVAESVQLVDVLWYNSGLAVAAGAQAIAMGGGVGPARDLNGSTDGEGVRAAILALSALGNAAAVATTTLTYRDSDNNSPNTGTFSAQVGWQSPATPVIGTWMPFQLAAGDRGIREISSFNSGTTFTSGTFALVLYRPLVTIANTVANAAGVVSIPAPGIRVYPGSCIMAISVGSASASTLAGSYTIMER